MFYNPTEEMPIDIHRITNFVSHNRKKYLEKYFRREGNDYYINELFLPKHELEEMDSVCTDYFDVINFIFHRSSKYKTIKLLKISIYNEIVREIRKQTKDAKKTRKD